MTVAPDQTGPATIAPVTWVLTDGKPGMENQCLGLAEAVGLPVTVHRLVPRALWRFLPPTLWPFPFMAAGAASGALTRPWPALLIASGRQSQGFGLAVKARSPTTFAVYIQTPGTARDRWDLIVAPEHDRLERANAVTTVGALHRVTPARLAAEAGPWRDRLAHLPHPRLAVLIGGTNAAFRFDAAEAATLGTRLAGLADQGWGLMVTASRRTGAEAMAALRGALGDRPAMIWDGEGENPYFGFLAHADAIVVTGDSVSMVTEACATGRPVHVVHLPGRSAKFAAFHDAMVRRGATRPFDGTLGCWTYPPPDDTAKVAALIRARAGLPALAASPATDEDSAR